jgi:DNA-binding NarL/FixJ family response regulator
MHLRITIHQDTHPESRLDVAYAPEFRVEVVARLTLTPETIPRLVELAPDALVADVRDLSLGTVTMLLRLWREALPSLRILTVGAEGDEEMARHAIASGSAAYLSRDHSPAALGHALRNVARGGWHLGATGKRAVASLLTPR